jgi:hypothetical protein
MATIAERAILRLLAHAEVGVAVFFGGEFYGREACASVGAIAERLVLGAPTSAPIVVLSFFEVLRSGLVVGDEWVHEVFRVTSLSLGRAHPVGQNLQRNS